MYAVRRRLVPMVLCLLAMTMWAAPAWADDPAPEPKAPDGDAAPSDQGDADPADEAALEEKKAQWIKLQARYREAAATGQMAQALAVAREEVALSATIHGGWRAGCRAMAYNNLGEVLTRTGKRDEALAAHNQALEVLEALEVLGTKNGSLLGRTLRHIGECHLHRSRFAKAQAALKRAVSAMEAALGATHPEVAMTLGPLAQALGLQGGLADALLVQQRALSIFDALPEDQAQHGWIRHPHVQAVVALAHGKDLAGALDAAQALYRRGLKMAEALYGRHPEFGNVLQRYAQFLLIRRGAFDEARQLSERARDLIVEMSGPRALPLWETERSLGDIALLHDNDPAAAEAHYRTAVSILEQYRGTGDPGYALVLCGVAEACKRQGKHDEAAALFKRVLKHQEALIGPDHMDTLSTVTQIGLLLVSSGKEAEGLKHMERAFERLKATGQNPKMVAQALTLLGAVYGNAGQVDKALPLLRRALRRTEEQLRSQFATLDAGSRQNLMGSLRKPLDGFLFLAHRAKLSGYEEVLRYKGLVTRAEALDRVLTRGAGEDEHALHEQMRHAERQVTRLANSMPKTRKAAPRAQWRKQYAAAMLERKRLLTDLKERLAPFRSALERLELSIADVRAQLPADAAFVDILRINKGYLAWVMKPDGEVLRVVVGETDNIEALCAEFMEVLLDDDSQPLDLQKAGTALRSSFWDRIEKALGPRVRHVILCPDAALSAIPFAALPGRTKGTHLIDDLRLTYVMSAHDLVLSSIERKKGKGALLVGGVDYESAAAHTAPAATQERPQALAAADRAPRGEAFVPLPQTRDEVEALQTKFGKKARVLKGTAATESRLRAELQGQRYLHIATHGFANESLRRGMRGRKGTTSDTSWDALEALAGGHDPMVLSGLAMAGANPRKGGGEDDGILTALEVSYLDLDSVDLVALSACMTARGTAASGEGVQGLVQGFKMAGARQVLASLWNVDDAATRLLMEQIYERILRKKNPLSAAHALHEAALSLRDFKDADGKARYAAPKFWAAFVCYGR